MLLVRVCLGPARGRFADSGGFGFRILDFEFVWDFDIGISDFPVWLRPPAALGGIQSRKSGSLLPCALRRRLDSGGARSCDCRAGAIF